LYIHYLQLLEEATLQIILLFISNLMYNEYFQLKILSTSKNIPPNNLTTRKCVYLLQANEVTITILQIEGDVDALNLSQLN